MNKILRNIKCSDLKLKIEACRHLLERRGKNLTVLFVANLFDGEKIDLDDDGISDTAQYYSSAQISVVKNGFLSLGVRFEAFLSEQAFMSEALKGKFASSDQQFLVFACSEGGAGSGKRALLPAFCRLMGIPSFPSGAHACSIARHKFHANSVLDRVGVRTPRTWMYCGNDFWMGDDAPPLGTKVILKPTYESNSIGIDDQSVVIAAPGYLDEIERRYHSFRQPVIVQQFISGVEVAAPILQLGGYTTCLPCVGFETPKGRKMLGTNRTFSDECVTGSVRYYTDVDLHESVIESFQMSARMAFLALEMSGMGRIDCRVDEDGRFWIFDTNESPPPLPGTSYLASLESIGLGYEDMLAAWLGSALERDGVSLD